MSLYEEGTFCRGGPFSTSRGAPLSGEYSGTPAAQPPGAGQVEYGGAMTLFALNEEQILPKKVEIKEPNEPARRGRTRAKKARRKDPQ